MIPLVLISCGPMPWNNDAPRIERVNGVEVTRAWGEVWLDPQRNARDRFVFEAGATMEFEVEVRDPEGQEVALWWPLSPPGFDFASDARKGTWTVPEDFDRRNWQMTLVAVDDADDREAESVSFTVFQSGWDSAETGRW